ncbi:MAG: hypothetical protein HY329_19260 [Chloroflexi bacterium]|nr:hypothetical protein [Chloroflexota bacterium]
MAALGVELHIDVDRDVLKLLGLEDADVERLAALLNEPSSKERVNAQVNALLEASGRAVAKSAKKAGRAALRHHKATRRG